MRASTYSRVSTDRRKQMRGLVVAALVAAGLCPMFAGAMDANGKFNVDIPAGEASCGTFVSARQESSRGNHFRENRYINWLFGFMSAYNWLQSDTYDVEGSTDTASQLLWLENYCKSHPLDSFALAVEHLTVTLYPNRRKAAPKE